MNKFIQRLLFLEKYQIQTKLSKQQILNRVKSFVDTEDTGYYGGVSENGFFVGEKFIKHSAFVRTQNSFAPIAKATIVENEGITTVSIVIRMHLIPLIVFIPMHIMFLLTIVLFPLELLILYFCFVKPAKRLKQEIENLLMEN